MHFVNESVVDQAERCAGIHDGRVGSTTELLSVYGGARGVNLPGALATVCVGIVDAGLCGIGRFESGLVNVAKGVEALWYA